MNQFLNTIKNIWKTEELRRKISITLFLLLVYRFGAYVPLAGIDPQEISNFIDKVNPGAKGLMQILSSFTGGAFNRASILALGIMPYISASIVVQLMCLALPYLQKIQKEGESGRKQINRITRWLTIGICMVQAPAYLTMLTTKFLPFSSVPQAYLLDITTSGGRVLFWAISVLLLTVGTLFSLWLGEKITDKGIGNGISLIIMAGIIARFPESIIMEIRNRLEVGNGGLIFLFLESMVWLLVILFSILIIQAVRKVPLQYVRHTQGNTSNYIRSVKQSARQYIPLKVTAAGVMPIIFAQAIMLLPAGLLTYVGNEKLQTFGKVFEDIYGFWYNLVFATLIILFTFFYTAITIPVNQMADDLKRNEAHIPKIKPGKDTADFLDNILSRITLPGSILLAIIAILPSVTIKFGVTQGFALFYGGTSLLIIVGVVLDTAQQINAYLLNRHYDGLMQGKRAIKK
ncbi:preprotein translocase subunit SecY [Bacteroidetes bacterium endosymbiont of Geopemphigus sp.]|uniref:preprotein translocase subunit SecY n=1 Tax=Bacteroidetes bacterium endosymbiont of Geopemphigus sp. TaxID=2047937 RepID=UPI000CD32CC7|nr:preprotein translocase subunit SecY [Bacteroidetes bacterium endosymbiont of Geopemphigus sp.]